MPNPDLTVILTDALPAIASILVPVLAVGAALVFLYVHVRGIRIVVDAIHGSLEQQRLNERYKKRYAREADRARYREWKSAQVGPRRRRRF